MGPSLTPSTSVAWIAHEFSIYFRTSGGSIAQRLEQGTHNSLVLGSNPSAPNSKLFRSRPMPDAIAVVSPLSYATPAAASSRHGARLWAAVGILFGGLGLVVLGGCFLIGVFSIVVNLAGNGQPILHVSTSGKALMIVLYVAAFSCFAAAVVLIFLGVRGLVHIIRSPQ